MNAGTEAVLHYLTKGEGMPIARYLTKRYYLRSAPDPFGALGTMLEQEVRNQPLDELRDVDLGEVDWRKVAQEVKLLYRGAEDP